MIRTASSFLPPLALLLSAGGLVAQNVYVVPGTHPTIQAAVNASVNGDTVNVLPGIYNENVDVQGKDITIRSFGGASATTIDGSMGSGPVVQFSPGSTRAALLEGFTITGANVTGNPPASVGGGIRVDGSSPTIRACIVTENTASSYGAGIGITGTAGPLIESCMIDSNHAQGLGYASGGGIAVNSATPGSTATEIIRCVVTDNDAATRGGGIYAAYSPGIRIDRCRITRNSTVGSSGNLNGGAGIFVALNSTATVTNNRIWNNVSASDGGGVKWFNVTGAQFVNNTIVANTGGGAAGTANSGAFGVGVVCDFANNIIWQNGAGPEFNFTGTNQTGAAPSANVNHCVVTGGYTGTANLNVAPQLLNTASGNHHLAPMSPCIDAGSAAFLPLPTTDMDGDARTVTGLPDIGADEYDASEPLLFSNTAELSVSSPMAINYSLVNGTPGDFFAVLFSLSGVEPGTVVLGRNAPLNPDGFTSTVTLIGGIDAAGNGAATFPTPGTIPASVIGVTLSSAGITFGSAIDITNDENVLIVP